MSEASTRERFSAEYNYPGSFFAETIGRDLVDGTYDSVLAAQPNDNWYAVTVYKTTERRFTDDDGNVRWWNVEREKVTSTIVGTLVHWTDIPDTDQNAILRSNIRSNSKDGYAVKTRRGNWQMASDYDFVVEL